MDRAYPALRQMFTDIRNVWFEKMGRELHNFSLDLRDFLYGLQNHPTHQWHERFHAFAAGQRFQGRYMTPESEEALFDYLSRWAAKKVIDSAPEMPDVELDPNAFDLTEAELAQARDGLFWWHAKPFEWGDGWWEEKFKSLANAARDKMLATCRELQTLGLLARNVDQLPDDGIDTLAQQVDRVNASHDEYVQALIDIQRSYLNYIKSSLYVGWLNARLIEKMAGNLPAPLFELPSSKLRALDHASDEVSHALGETASRMDIAYKVAYWADIAITAIEFATGVIGVAKAVLKREIAKGVTRALAKKIAIRAAIKQAAIQGAVLLGSLYGLPILIKEAGLNPEYVFAGVLILQGLTAFQALRSVETAAARSTGTNVSPAKSRPEASEPNGPRPPHPQDTVHRSRFFRDRLNWTRVVTFRGLKVYQRSDLIDARKMDADGLTSLDRMRRGLAPIGPDDNPIELHHMLQTDDGPIAELTKTFHVANYDAIHVNPRTTPSGIDRSKFDYWRIKYWMFRANDFE